MSIIQARKQAKQPKQEQNGKRQATNMPEANRAGQGSPPSSAAYWPKPNLVGFNPT